MLKIPYVLKIRTFLVGDGTAIFVVTRVAGWTAEESWFDSLLGQEVLLLFRVCRPAVRPTERISAAGR
jgi:hypothetical protein